MIGRRNVRHRDVNGARLDSFAQSLTAAHRVQHQSSVGVEQGTDASRRARRNIDARYGPEPAGTIGLGDGCADRLQTQLPLLIAQRAGRPGGRRIFRQGYRAALPANRLR